MCDCVRYSTYAHTMNVTVYVHTYVGTYIHMIRTYVCSV